jgi:hypothetical protein
MSARKPKAFADVRKETAERMAETPADDHIPCRYCGTATPRSTLSSFGARCRPCYDQFLRVGYSGAHPPEQVARSPQVAADAARFRAHGAGVPNAFAGLAAAIEAKRAQRAIPQGLADDDVNAMLQQEAS